ncbi:MAG: YneF family protein [Mycoplasmataceae bacterium]|nr:YneF family protein [Mycoplasmataceae bacterium]
MPIWLEVFIPLMSLLLSGFIGYKVGTWKLKKKMKETPFLNRRQIKAIFKSMGLQISEQNVNQMENSMKNSMEGHK